MEWIRDTAKIFAATLLLFIVFYAGAFVNERGSRLRREASQSTTCAPCKCCTDCACAGKVREANGPGVKFEDCTFSPPPRARDYSKWKPQMPIVPDEKPAEDAKRHKGLKPILDANGRPCGPCNDFRARLKAIAKARAEAATDPIPGPEFD